MNKGSQNQLPGKDSTRQATLIHDTDKDDTGMSIEQVNEYLVKRSAVICEHVRKSRRGSHTSDIIPPICYIGQSLQENIKSVLACFSNTLSAALSSEAKYIQTLHKYEALDVVTETERNLMFDFLSEGDLVGKFDEFIKRRGVGRCRHIRLFDVV